MVGWLLALAFVAPALNAEAFRTIGRAWFNAGEAYLLRADPTALPAHLRTCANCHTEVAAEWRQSLHAQAWTDPIFQNAYRQEPVARCRHCHSPHGDPQGPAQELAKDGVSCAACHVRDGAIFGVRERPDGSVGHGVKAAPEMASAGYCAGCHQFGMFGTPKRDHNGRFELPQPQQDTFAEWTRSQPARLGQACQHCHMAQTARLSGKPGRSHRFLGADTGQMQRSVRVELRASAAAAGTTVTAAVSAPGVGHGFPTGDIFRRARLRLWCDGQPASAIERTLARTFAMTSGRDPRHGAYTSLRQVSDTRVPASEELLVSVQLPACATVQWSLDYDKMPLPDAKGRPGQPEQTLRVGQGRVEVTR